MVEINQNNSHSNKYEWVARWQTEMFCWLPPSKTIRKTREVREENGFQKLNKKRENSGKIEVSLKLVSDSRWKGKWW